MHRRQVKSELKPIAGAPPGADNPPFPSDSVTPNENVVQLTRKTKRPQQQAVAEVLPPLSKQTKITKVLKPEAETRQAIAFVQEDRKLGRPTIYRPEFDQLVYELRLAAVPNEAIARIFNVTELTLQNWQHVNSSFMIHWEEGGDLADAKVAGSMYNRATGFTKWLHKRAWDRKTGELREWEEEVYYPPDTMAGIFWLTNRKRRFWQQTSRQDISNSDGSLQPPSINVSFVSPQPEQLTDAAD